MSSFEEYYYKNIGKKVRMYREANGLTQEQFSEILGKNIKYVGHIERAERIIGSKMLTTILDYFKVQPQEFFNFDEYYQWNKK